jgi:hypothetical protein
MIQHLTVEKLKILAAIGGVKSIELVAVADGFVMRINVKGDDAFSGALETDKGHVRTFSKLDTAAKMIFDMGIGKATLDLQGWTSGQKKAV